MAIVFPAACSHLQVRAVGESPLALLDVIHLRCDQLTNAPSALHLQPCTFILGLDDFDKSLPKCLRSKVRIDARVSVTELTRRPARRAFRSRAIARLRCSARVSCSAAAMAQFTSSAFTMRLEREFAAIGMDAGHLKLVKPSSNGGKFRSCSCKN